MFVLAWAAGLWLAAHYFGLWEDARRNPNREPVSRHTEAYVEVELIGDGRGHYIASGEINGQPVQFLLDTGATDVAIPGELAKKLGLEPGAKVTVRTANGTSDGYRTVLDDVKLGDIVLHNVRALAASGFDGEQVLLGMSALRQLEFTQRDGRLLLRHYREN
ncbi:aspartyl protease [Pseudomonas matsuisoli]|uniref:Aspartyl protease n=2 Tax=Pseudomonas matsuisoli TaxID=1515666 RepID=A0A917Q3Q4_9PSED|nr:aspartyl protease [Pseudomonas matsuisoli]